MFFAFGSILSSCAVTRMLPSGPVLSAAERARHFVDAPPSGVEYLEAVDFSSAPRIPFLVFGVSYDIDIVLVSDHPDWDMHEYARISTPDGPKWLAKDSRASNGDQLLVADIEGIDAWLPEIPLARKNAELRVEDRSTEEMLDVSLSYENHDGEGVEVHYIGPPPRTLQSKRNGSTMGHSRHQVLAVLDLSHQNFGKEATVEIGGQERRVHRVLGIIPMRLALQQTQGGVAQASFEQSSNGERVTTTHTMPSGAVVTQQWEWTRREAWSELRQRHPLREVVYRFRHTEGGAAELVEATVTPWDGDEPNFRVRFSPALPDARVRFEEEHRSRFVMDVGTQANHAVGEVVVQSSLGGTVLEMRPEAPWWAAERTVISSVNQDGITHTTVRPE